MSEIYTDILTQIKAMQAWAINASQEINKNNPIEAIKFLKQINQQGRKLDYKRNLFVSFIRGNKIYFQSTGNPLKFDNYIPEVQQLKKNITSTRAGAIDLISQLDKILAIKKALKNPADFEAKTKSSFNVAKKYINSLIEQLVQARNILENEPWLPEKVAINHKDKSFFKKFTEEMFRCFSYNANQTKIKLKFIANLDHSNLSNLYTYNVDISGANFSGADLSKSQFRHEVNLSEANFSKANLKGAFFFDRVNCLKTNFSGADLSKAEFRSVNLSGANFSGADLSKAKFEFVNLSGANFSGADIANVDFKGSGLQGVNFQEITFPTFPEKLKFERANLNRANLSNKNLVRAIFKYANLIEVNFNNSNIVKANFSEAIIDGANFEGANLSGAYFGNDLFYRITSIAGANFKGAFLPGADFKRANLIKANFENANLNDADLVKTDLLFANFKGANLKNADLTGAQVEGVTFTTEQLNSMKNKGLKMKGHFKTI